MNEPELTISPIAWQQKEVHYYKKGENMLSLILILFLSGDAQAQTAAKKLNANLFEQENDPEKDSSVTFTAKVRLVREESDGVEVFFEGEKNRGAYALPRSTEHYAKALKTLEESRKTKGPMVSVTASKDKRIKSVEKSKDTGYVPPSDPNQAWDFGKIPD